MLSLYWLKIVYIVIIEDSNIYPDFFLFSKPEYQTKQNWTLNYWLIELKHSRKQNNSTPWSVVPLALFILIGLDLRPLIISNLFRLSCLSCVPFCSFCPFPLPCAFPAFPVVLQAVDLGSGKDTLRRSSLSWKMPRSDPACTRHSPCTYFQFWFDFLKQTVTY